MTKRIDAAGVPTDEVFKITQFTVENFMKVKLLEVTPDGNVIVFSGRNGQGKTSAINALWFLLKGKAALPAKAVRNGAERLMVKGNFGAFTVTRTCTEGAIPTLTLEMAKGRNTWGTHQAMLDSIMGLLSFDPLEFVRMDTAAKVELLRQVAGVDSAVVDKLNQENETDYDARNLVNRDVKALKAQIDAMTVLEGLPAQKIDEQAILKKLNDAGELNRRAQEVFRAKEVLAQKVTSAQLAVDANERLIAEQDTAIADLEAKLEQAKKVKKAGEVARKSLATAAGEAIAAHKNAPSGEPIDVTALTVELQSAQRTNRAIDVREQFDRLKAQHDAKDEESKKLTRAIDAREEKKRTMLAKAKMPVDGLVLGAQTVLYNGIPIENLGEGEQIRISTKIGMAANPRLRVLAIRHGEALDEDGMKVLTQMAKENNFQIWMAKVDTSGKLGIVLEDGMVVARNGEE